MPSKQQHTQLSPLSTAIAHLIEQKLCTVVQLTELLHCSADSLYRRLRGETDFLLHEAIIIANHLNISLDSLYKLPTGLIQFNTRQLINEVDGNAVATIEAYVQQLLHDFTMVDKLGIVHMYYAAKDLPLFAFFANDTLTEFKLYFWYLVLFGPSQQRMPFKQQWLPQQVLQQAKQLYQLYNVHPSTEIWNYESINSTLHQVKYCVDCGLMPKPDGHKILEALQQYVQDLHINCDTGIKCRLGTLQLYLNEILILDNSVIFDLGNHKIFYMPYQTLNFFNTTNSEFVEKSIEWMKRQQSRSVLISSTNDKDRNRLFTHYYNAITQAKEQL
jgi:hypothetical protein